MADEPKWEAIEAPSWAQQPAWEPIETPSWAKGKPAERGVLERAGSAAAETFKGGAEDLRKLVTPRTKAEVEEDYGVTGALKGLKETGLGLLSPLTMTAGTALAVPQSLIASGMAGITPGKETSERKYEEWYPKIGTAMIAAGPARGAGAIGPASKVGATRVPATGLEAEAGRFIEGKATDPAALRGKLAQPDQEIVPGSQPTTFQLTGDQGLGQLERGAARRPGQVEQFKERQAAQNQARQDVLEQMQPTGTPTDVSQHLREALRAETVAADEAAQQASQRAWEATQAMGGTNDATTYGNIFRQELRMAEDAARGRERALWQRVDPDGTLLSNPQRLQEAERGIYGPNAMTETAAASLTPAETQIAGLIQNYPSVIRFRELQDLRSLTSTALREELYTRGQTPAYARLSRLRQGIEEAIPGSFTETGEAAGGVAERLREASAATRQRAATFRPTRAITRREGVEGPYKLEEVSTIPGKIIAPGAKGYDTTSAYLRAVGNERGLPELQDAVAASLRREAVNPDGTISPRKLEGWFKRYQDTLRAIDDRDGGAFSQSLRNIGTAQDAIEAATARQASVAKQQSSDQFKQLAGAVDDADVARMIGGILGRQDSVQRARALAQRLTTEEAKEGARRALVTHLRERLTGNALIGEDPLLRAEQFQTFVKTNRAALAQILKPEQVANLEAIALDLRRAARSNQTKATGGGSDTVQNWLAQGAQESQFAEIAKKYGKFGAKVIAHWLGAPFGLGGTAVVSLGEAAIGAAGAARAARKAKRIETIQEMVDDAMLNPAKAAEYLGKTHKTKTKTSGKAAGVGYAGAVTSDQQRQRKSRQAGGGVPAVGGTGGRSFGATTPAGAGAARQGPSQALSDGGAAGDEQADPSYETELSPGEEHVFQSWKQKYAPQDSGEDYDFRGAFKAGAKPDPHTNHWVDTFKKPNHPTFSDQSQYAKDRPDLAGSWDGDTYVPPQGRAEGGEVAAQPQSQAQPPGLRERWGALQTGTIAGGGGGGKPGKAATGLLRKDIVDTLKRHGINDKEVLSGWAESDPTVDSRAEGGAVEGDDERQYFMPPGAGGSGDWPIGQPRPPSEKSSGLDTVAGAMQDQTAAAQQPTYAGLLRWRPEAFQNFIANAPRSTNIEDRTRQPKVSLDDPAGGYEPSAGPTEDLSDTILARELGYGAVEGALERYRQSRLPPVPLPRPRPSRRADGGEIDYEDKLPLPGQSRGLSSTAGPTVTSTTREEDIPAPRTNKAGETFPTALLKHWGEGLITLPERATHAAGELQRQGDVYDPGPALETAMTMWGARTPFMKQGDLGVFGGRGSKTANLDMLKRAEEMHAQGATPESIWNQTGWAQGPDAKWRYEIPDQASFTKPTERIPRADAASVHSGYRAGTLEEVIHHPEYFEAYPQFKSMPASVELGEKKGGGYMPPTTFHGTAIDKGSIEARAPHPEDAREVLLHEMQHAIQETEGFGPGANPRQLPYTQRQMTELTKRYADLQGVDWKTMTPAQRAAAEKQVRYDMYRMYAGEVEARNVQARADFENRQVPPWKTEDVKREFQLVPTEQARAGFPVKGRKPFMQMSVERPEGIGAPGIVRSEFDRPLFDYSRMREVPNTPQFDLPRIIPARGVPEHAMRLGDPRNMQRVNEIVKMGLQHGGREWYNTMPLLERYVGERGALRGPEDWRSYLNYVGATSPRTPVPTNVGVASHYDMLAAQGRPFPQPVKVGNNWSLPPGQLPEGYGSLAQATNAHNAQMVRDQGGWPSWTFFDKPKPPSFTSNLQGNYRPVTSDVHNISMLGMRGPNGQPLIMPPHQLYGHVERLQQGPMGAESFGISPAQYQAAGWIPWAAGYRTVGRSGEVTGGNPAVLKRYAEPFIKVVEDRVKETARELGWSPEQTLRAFLRKEIAIAGVPAAAIPLLQDHLQQVDQGGS